jgi:hypothetical protein
MIGGKRSDFPEKGYDFFGFTFRNDSFDKNFNSHVALL